MAILNEVAWEESYTAFKAIKKHPSDWVHFTDVQKLGINPGKTHHDPPGIYFYPCKFLIKGDWGGFQYGLTMKYYYVCRIGLRSAKGFTLGRVEQWECEKIAAQNGWINEYRAGLDLAKQNFGLVAKRRDWEYLTDSPMDKNLLKKPGAMFYAVADYLASKGQSWLKLLKGLDYIRDSGKGIISYGEIDQLIVMNPKLIQVLEFGENKDTSYSAYGEMLAKVAKKYDGTLTWKDKTPVLDLKIGRRPMRVVYDPFRTLTMQFIYHRDGMLVSTHEKIENVFSDRISIDSMRGDLEYYIDRFGKDAQIDSGEHYWTSERIQSLFQLLFTQTSRLQSNYNEKGNTQSYWTNDGNDYATVHAQVDQSDTLRIKLGAGYGVYRAFKLDFAVTHEYPAGTDIGPIANQLLDEVAAAIKQNIVATGSEINAYGLGLICHLRMGDRLGTKQQYEQFLQLSKLRQGNQVEA